MPDFDPGTTTIATGLYRRRRLILVEIVQKISYAIVLLGSEFQPSVKTSDTIFEGSAPQDLQKTLFD